MEIENFCVCQRPRNITIKHLIDKDFYQYQDLTENLDLPVDGYDACQYQICVNETTCEDITVTKQGHQLLADIQLNQSPAVLSFCKTPAGIRTVCSVVQQTEGIWGRDDDLYPNDRIIPTTLHLQKDKLEQRQGNILTVEESVPVILTNRCVLEQAIILARFYGFNGQPQFKRLCDGNDCICLPEDTEEPACQDMGYKAGVSIIQ